MASPLEFRGGFQVTGNPSGTSALLRFNSDTFQTLVDTAYGQDINIQFGGSNLAFTGNYVTYNSTLMLMLF
jgi:hypothetical protein